MVVLVCTEGLHHLSDDSVIDELALYFCDIVWKNISFFVLKEALKDRKNSINSLKSFFKQKRNIGTSS